VDAANAAWAYDLSEGVTVVSGRESVNQHLISIISPVLLCNAGAAT
jgi:hypothetical protein